MASSTLANEFRPRTWQDVLGHERYVKGLRNMVVADELPSAILIAGNAGTGKTTLGRIIAAAAMCTKVNRQTGDPCGDCANCKSAQGINDGVNFMHLDGGGRKLKDTVEDELKPFLHASPAAARYKAALNDEAQALSDAATNSLLTMLENMPRTSLMIMTTTDPEDIPFAIRTRALTIYLGDVTAEDMVKGVLSKQPELAEHEEALMIIAKASSGSMRQMWQNVKLVKSFNEPITEELVSWLTGGADRASRQAIWNAIATRKPAKVVELWKELLKKGANAPRLGMQFFDDLIEMSTAKPDERDWVEAIHTMARAQMLGNEAAWRAALVALVPRPPVAAAKLDLDYVIEAVTKNVVAAMPAASMRSVNWPSPDQVDFGDEADTEEFTNIPVERGSGNVFADLGLPDADKLLADADSKMRTAKEQEWVEKADVALEIAKGERRANGHLMDCACAECDELYYRATAPEYVLDPKDPIEVYNFLTGRTPRETAE